MWLPDDKQDKEEQNCSEALPRPEQMVPLLLLTDPPYLFTCCSSKPCGGENGPANGGGYSGERTGRKGGGEVVVVDRRTLAVRWCERACTRVSILGRLLSMQENGIDRVVIGGIRYKLSLRVLPGACILQSHGEDPPL